MVKRVLDCLKNAKPFQLMSLFIIGIFYIVLTLIYFKTKNFIVVGASIFFSIAFILYLREIYKEFYNE